MDVNHYYYCVVHFKGDTHQLVRISEVEALEEFLPVVVLVAAVVARKSFVNQLMSARAIEHSVWITG